MAGEGQEVDVERLHVERQVRHALRRVDQDSGAGGMRLARDRGDVVDGAEGVADVGDGHQLRLALQQIGEGRHIEAVVVGQGNVGDLRAPLRGQELPGDQVGVVLHDAEDDQVALADVAAAPGLGDEVDRLGRVADEDALPRRRRR